MSNPLAADTAWHSKETGTAEADDRTVYKIAAKAVMLDITAIEKAAAEFKVPANRLLVVRR